MKKIFLILLSVFIFSVNVFSQIVYSNNGERIRVKLEGTSTEIALNYDNGKLVSVELKDANSDFQFMANLDTDDGDDDYYHSYSFRIGDFQDVANAEVRNKNKENINAEIFRQTIIDNSSELIITGYVSDDELNKTLEDIRANLKGTPILDEFEKEQLAWENYKAAHLKLFSNIFDKENPSVEVQNEIKKMNAMRMSELLSYSTREYDNKQERQ